MNKRQITKIIKRYGTITRSFPGVRIRSVETLRGYAIKHKALRKELNKRNSTWLSRMVSVQPMTGTPTNAQPFKTKFNYTEPLPVETNDEQTTS